MIALQFACVWRMPSGQVPGEASQRRLQTELAGLRSITGPVYLPGHGWLLARAGKSSSAQSAAIADVLRGPSGSAKADLARQLDTAIATQHYAAVIVDHPRVLSYLPRTFVRYYRFDQRLIPPHAGRDPVTGTGATPSEVWVPRNPASG